MPIDDQNCPELVCCNENPFVGECCQPTPFDYSSQQFSNIEQNYTATCPEGLCGEPVSVTVPSGAYTSTVSQADADAQALAAAQAEAQSQLVCIDCDPGECAPTTYDTVQPTIENDTPSYFNSGASWPSGIYRVTYIEGALRYNEMFDWGLNDSALHRFTILYNDGAAEAIAPSLDYQKLASQVAIEVHNAGQFVEFTHTGGKIGVFLEDFPYSDNVPGSPTPIFRLSKVCTPAPTFVCDDETGSVESVMRVLQERQYVVTATEVLWPNRANPGTEDPPLPLTPTPAYPPDGFFSGDNTDAQRAFQVQAISDNLDDIWLTLYSPNGNWEGVDRISVFYTATAGNVGTNRVADSQLVALVVDSGNWPASLQTLLDYCCQLQWIVVLNTGDDSTTQERETPGVTGSDCETLRAYVANYWTTSTSWAYDGVFCMKVDESTNITFVLAAIFSACRSKVQFATNLMIGGVASSFWKLNFMPDSAIAGHLDVAPIQVVDQLFHQGSDAPPLDGTNFFSALYGDVGDTITFEGACPGDSGVRVGWRFEDAVVQVFKSPDPALGHWNYYP